LWPCFWCVYWACGWEFCWIKRIWSSLILHELIAVCLGFLLILRVLVVCCKIVYCLNFLWLNRKKLICVLLKTVKFFQNSNLLKLFSCCKNLPFSAFF
jgi:hypothetical protein